jgi:hypothetical protein
MMIKLIDLLEVYEYDYAGKADFKKAETVFNKHATKIKKAFDDDGGGWSENNGRTPAYKKLVGMVDSLMSDLRKQAGYTTTYEGEAFAWFSDPERRDATRWNNFVKFMSR